MRLFSKKEITIIGATVAAVTVVAVVITVTTGLSKREKAAFVTGEPDGQQAEVPYITDVVIPEEFTLTGGERWYFSREPLKQWNQDQVDLFWIDPAEIGIELMREQTDAVIRDFVKEIP
ncbi:MAG: hypothetical protein JW852_04900 [Spirochaetales bacterium]|nr:hypothetical protein [Spirochaetales bacterium]